LSRLHSQVYEEIAIDLKAGNFSPGQKVPVRQLARQYECGLMPVREALQRLSAQRAVDVAANKTVRVPLFSADEYRDLTGVLFLLERSALARFFRQRGGPRSKAKKHVSELRQVLARVDGFAERHDYAAYLRSLARLWQLIFAESGSRVLAEYIESMTLRVGPLLGLPLRKSGLVRDYYFFQHANLMQELFLSVDEGRGDDAERCLEKLHSFINEWLVQHHF
jgi:DNA-binding GntR family transcriptional regulator